MKFFEPTAVVLACDAAAGQRDAAASSPSACGALSRQRVLSRLSAAAACAEHGVDGKRQSATRSAPEQQFADVVGRQPVDDEVAEAAAADERGQRRAGDDLDRRGAEPGEDAAAPPAAIRPGAESGAAVIPIPRAASSVAGGAARKPSSVLITIGGKARTTSADQRRPEAQAEIR